MPGLGGLLTTAGGFLLLLIAWATLIGEVYQFLKAMYDPGERRSKPIRPLRFVGEVITSYFLAIYLFGVIFFLLHTHQPGSFGEVPFNFLIAQYFSIVTITTTGYGDISPKSGLAMFFVAIEILFGYFYTLMFLSVIATFAFRSRGDAKSDKDIAE
jgi:hypothetical protein